jgi:hypothetical protein
VVVKEVDGKCDLHNIPIDMPRQIQTSQLKFLIHVCHTILKVILLIPLKCPISNRLFSEITTNDC